MKMDAYPIKRVEDPSRYIEQKKDVPIIDIIRHAETDYKQRYKTHKLGYYKRDMLDIDASDFALDSEHLDLTDEGIKTMQATALDILNIIDKNKEVVLIVSSPAQRADSSALIVEKILRENGVPMLEEVEKGYQFFEYLNEADSRVSKTKFENPDVDIRSEDFKNLRRNYEALELQRFLRHMNNIYKYLRPETLEKLKGKRLRIVCFSHAEVTASIIHATFGTTIGTGEGHKNSQILEIRPESQLEEGVEVATNVKLYSKEKNEKEKKADPETKDERHPEREAQVKRGFKLKIKE